MDIASIRMVGFRSYADTQVELSPGLNVIVGKNASGKTNLVEAAYWALRGSSPRTTRDEKLVRWGAEFARVELVVRSGPTVAMTYAPSRGRRATIDGAEVGSLDRLHRLGPAFLFVPESLLLIKGGPARRRAHLDGFGATLEPAYGRAVAAFREAVRQRNALLGRVGVGGDVSPLDVWDAQYVTAALDLAARRRALVAALDGPFERYAAELAPDRARFGVSLRETAEEVGADRDAFLGELQRRRARELRSGISAYGPHRDDLEVFEERPDGGRRDLRTFGSQGEQRAAVLALLLAERHVARQWAGEQGPLFLDDVMSELDDVRRRLLVGSLAGAGQALVTTTTTMYFRPEELRAARIIELGREAERGEGDG